MKDLNNQIKLKRQRSASFGKAGRVLVKVMWCTSIVPIGLIVSWCCGKGRFLSILDTIVLSTGCVLLFSVLALLCFTAETKYKDDASELEHSRDGLS